MNFPACEPPEQKGIDCSERELARQGPDAKASDVLQQPTNLRGREIRIEHEPGFAEQPRFVGLPVLAKGRGPAILPDDGPSHQGMRAAIPNRAGFSLVRDPNGGEVTTLDSRLGQGL